MKLLRIIKYRPSSDQCAKELYDVVFWVLSYFKATLMEENGEMDEDQVVKLVKERTYEMLLLSLWVMHTYLPSEELRDKVYERFFTAVKHGSSDIGRLLSVDMFKEDLEDRINVYACAYDKVRFNPSVGVNQFGGMVAKAIQYGNHPSDRTANVHPHEVSNWYFRTRVAINKWHNEISRRQLVATIEKYSNSDLSHL
jgi:hypothetical protein